MPRNQFQRTIFALLTVIITVHAYVFYSLYVLHGDILMQILKQGQYKPKTLDEQVIALFLAKYNYLDVYELNDAINGNDKDTVELVGIYLCFQDPKTLGGIRQLINEKFDIKIIYAIFYKFQHGNVSFHLHTT